MNGISLLSILLPAVTILLVGATIFMGFWIRRSLKDLAPEKDGSAILLQQQIEALRSQIGEAMSRTSALTQQQLSQVTSQVQQQMSSVTQSVQTTAGQINSRIDSYSQVVQNVSHQLGSLAQATEKIFEATKNISTLEEILKPPKLRGGMGEILLENLLREILPSPEFFELQFPFKNGNTVDAVIRLKDGLIPIDAKFPLDNFKKMVETKDDKERNQLRKEFVRNIKKHIDDISDKYLLPDEGTLNFALMYVPAENVYYEIVIRNDETEDLYAYSAKKHVFPVSPNSLYPYLMTLALGFRGLKIEKQAKEILSELSRLHGDLERFEKDFRMVGDHLSNAQKKFGEAEKKLDRVETKVAALTEGAPQPELKLLNEEIKP